MNLSLSADGPLATIVAADPSSKNVRTAVASFSESLVTIARTALAAAHTLDNISRDLPNSDALVAELDAARTSMARATAALESRIGELCAAASAAVVSASLES